MKIIATFNKLLNSLQLGLKKGDLLWTVCFTQTLLSTEPSIDFAKAFEKIGLHTIINQLLAWACSPIITNYKFKPHVRKLDKSID